MVRLAWRKTPTKRLSQISSVSEETDLNVNSLPQFGATNDEKPKEELVAVKIFHKSILRECRTMSQDSSHHLQVRTALESVEREIAVMKLIQHPNLVSLYEVIDNEELDQLYMVIEYIPLGEIMTYVPKTDRYRRRERRGREPALTGVTAEVIISVIGEIYDCFINLEDDLISPSCHIVSSEISNLRLDSRGYIKISDFGVSHLFEDEESSVVSASSDLVTSSMDARHPERLSRRESDAAMMMKSMANMGKLSKTEGTWCFWSPEMCAENSLVFSAYACDIWAEIPMVLFEMIAEATLPDLKSYGMSDVLIDLLQKVLTKDPAERAGVGDCLQHQFCAIAREQRIRELGDDVEKHDRKIVPEQRDLRQALSTTKRSSARDIALKFGQRLSLVRQHFSTSSRSISREDLDENEVHTRRRSQRQRVSLNSSSKQESGFVDHNDNEEKPILMQQDSTASLSSSVCAIQ
eukprot:scaffold339582_cov99-Cyclotella_meneghiniana.AAC.2